MSTVYDGPLGRVRSGWPRRPGCRRSPAPPSRGGVRLADRAVDLVGRHRGGNEQDPLEPERLARLLGDGQMGDVDRIERATEDPDRATPDGAAGSRRGPRSPALPGLRLPFELGRPDTDGVARPRRRPAAARRRCPSAGGRAGIARPTPRSRSWSARRSARSAGRARGTRRPRRSPPRSRPSSPRSGGPRRLPAPARPSSSAGGRSAASRSRNASRPVPGRCGDGHRVESLARPGSTERRPCVGRGWQVDLVERDEHRLLEQGRVVGLELLADDRVVPFGIA